jgi:glutamate racemase
MEPAIKPAARLTKTGIVGVLATAGTLKADKYKDTRGKYADDVTIVEHIGQGFVELVESGHTTGEKAEAIVTESIEPLLDAGVDTIVLGCTHYPFLSETISKVAAALAPERIIHIVDPAPAVARHLNEVMTEKNIIRHDGYDLQLQSSGEMTTLENIVKTL